MSTHHITGLLTHWRHSLLSLVITSHRIMCQARTSNNYSGMWIQSIRDIRVSIEGMVPAYFLFVFHFSRFWYNILKYHNKITTSINIGMLFDMRCRTGQLNQGCASSLTGPIADVKKRSGHCSLACNFSFIYQKMLCGYHYFLIKKIWIQLNDIF